MRVPSFVLGLVVAAPVASAARCKPALPSSSTSSPAPSSSPFMTQASFSILGQDSGNLGANDQVLEVAGAHQQLLFSPFATEPGYSPALFVEEAVTGYLVVGSLYVGYLPADGGIYLATLSDVRTGAYIPLVCNPISPTWTPNPPEIGQALSCAPAGMPSINTFAIPPSYLGPIPLYIFSPGSVPGNLISTDLVAV